MGTFLVFAERGPDEELVAPYLLTQNDLKRLQNY